MKKTTLNTKEITTVGCCTQGCGLVVDEMVENPEVSGSELIGDKETLGDSFHLF